MRTVENRFSITGIKCDGCIAKAREALSQIPGYVEADFDLKEGIAVVKDDIDPQAVIKALTSAGYPAVIKNQ